MGKINKSKILIIGKSQFSKAPAMLNKNVVVVPPGTKTPLKRWISKDEFLLNLDKYLF